jgi:hypothetical protein
VTVSPARWVALSIPVLLISVALAVAVPDLARAADDIDDMEGRSELADRAVRAVQASLDSGASAAQQAEAGAEHERLLSPADSVSATDHGAWEEDLSVGTVVFLGIPLLLLLSSPFTALISFSKGRRAEGWMGSAAIPAIGILFLVARAWVSTQDLDFGAGIAVGMMMLAVFLAVGGTLTIGSLVGAVGLAAPDSRWAQRWYDEEKMAAAGLKRAKREGFVLPPPPPQARD